MVTLRSKTASERNARLAPIPNSENSALGKENLKPAQKPAAKRQKKNLPVSKPALVSGISPGASEALDVSFKLDTRTRMALEQGSGSLLAEEPTPKRNRDFLNSLPTEVIIKIIDELWLLHRTVHKPYKSSSDQCHQVGCPSPASIASRNSRASSDFDFLDKKKFRPPFSAILKFVPYRLIGRAWDGIIFEKYAYRLFSNIKFGPLDAERTLQVFRGRPQLQKCVSSWIFLGKNGSDDVAHVRDEMYRIWDDMAKWEVSEKGISLIALGYSFYLTDVKDKLKKQMLNLSRPLAPIPAIKRVAEVHTRLFEKNKRMSIHLSPCDVAKIFKSFTHLDYFHDYDFGVTEMPYIMIPGFEGGTQQQKEQYEDLARSLPHYPARTERFHLSYFEEQKRSHATTIRDLSIPDPLSIALRDFSQQLVKFSYRGHIGPEIFNAPATASWPHMKSFTVEFDRKDVKGENWYLRSASRAAKRARLDPLMFAATQMAVNQMPILEHFDVSILESGDSGPQLRFETDMRLPGVDTISVGTAKDWKEDHEKHKDDPPKATILLDDEWVPRRELRLVWEERWPALRYGLRRKYSGSKIVGQALLDSYSGDA